MAQSNQAVFDQRIHPILEKNCAGCHTGPSASGGLNMATFDSVLAGGKHGAAIVPGDSKESLLLQYVRGERSPKMPMGGALDADRIGALAKAVDEMKATAASAKKSNPYLDWLLHKPSAPSVPVVQDASWVKNPVDAFILSKLEAKGLKPAPPASKRALLRRVYFDLIGLPPTPAELDAFQSDAAPDAYEKIVDKLLADPRYGERWGRHWLDLARFAESDGFAIDGERPTAWRYRDYVIRSFNQDILPELRLEVGVSFPGTHTQKAESDQALGAVTTHLIAGDLFLDERVVMLGHVPNAPRDAYWKSGAGGFGIYIVPSLDLVIYKLGGNDAAYSEALTRLPQPEGYDGSRTNWKATKQIPEAGVPGVLELVSSAVVAK